MVTGQEMIHNTTSIQLYQPDRTSKSTVTRIKNAGFSEQHYVAAGLILAFANDPVMRWLYPDSHQYLTHFPDFVKAFGGQAFNHDSAYVVNGCSGAALWLPPDVESNTEVLLDLFHRSVVQSQHQELFAVLSEMERYHIPQPHWYLAILGVEPSQQRKGYGSALMQPVLTDCDQMGISAYLESSKPSNLPFYERHGFELLGTIQVGTLPPIFPMVRHPR